MLPSGAICTSPTFARRSVSAGVIPRCDCARECWAVIKRTQPISRRGNLVSLTRRDRKMLLLFFAPLRLCVKFLQVINHSRNAIFDQLRAEINQQAQPFVCDAQV